MKGPDTNVISLVGVVQDPPKQTSELSNRSMCEFTLGNRSVETTQELGRQSVVNTFSVRMYKDIAVKALSELRSGDRISLVGRVRIKKRDRSTHYEIVGNTYQLLDEDYEQPEANGNERT